MTELPPFEISPLWQVHVGEDLILTRDVQTSEIDWLPFDLLKGDVVKRASDPYGCCSPDEIPIVLVEDGPYYGVPKDALGLVP